MCYCTSTYTCYSCTKYASEKNLPKPVTGAEFCRWLFSGSCVVFGIFASKYNINLKKAIETQTRTIHHPKPLQIDQIITSQENSYISMKPNTENAFHQGAFKSYVRTFLKVDPTYRVISMEAAWEYICEHELWISKEKAQRLWVEKPLRLYQTENPTTFHYEHLGQGNFFVGNDKNTLFQGVMKIYRIPFARTTLGFGLIVSGLNFCHDYSVTLPSIRRKTNGEH